MMTQVRTEVMSMSAQVWWFFEFEFGSRPYELLKMVDPSHGARPLDIAAKFLDEKPCDLDECFSAK